MISNNPPMGHPAATRADPARRNKYVLIAVWVALAALGVLPSILINLYTFGGINFQDGTLARVWRLGGPTLLYGSMIAAPIAAVVGVRSRNIGYPLLLAVLAVPIVLQVLALVLYVVFVDIYGAVCC